MWPGDSGLTVLFDDAPDPTEVQPDDPRITLVCLCSASSPDSLSRLRYGDGAPWPITISSMVGLASGDDWKARADGKDRQLLNSRDIAALNRAREVLKRLEDAALGRSLGQYDPCAPVAGWDLGRLSEAATAADDAILRVLSVARTYGGVKITDAQLVGRVQARQPMEQVAQPTDATQSVEMDRVPERIEEAPAASLRASGGSTGARNSGRGAGSRAARSG